MSSTGGDDPVKFVVLTFNDHGEGAEVALSTWMFEIQGGESAEKKLFCRWPHTGAARRVENKERSDPEWPCYTVTRQASALTYENAKFIRDAFNKGESMSSDNQLTSVYDRKKRIRRPVIRLLDSGDDADKDSEEEHLTPKKITKTKLTMPKFPPLDSPAKNTRQQTKRHTTSSFDGNDTLSLCDEIDLKEFDPSCSSRASSHSARNESQSPSVSPNVQLKGLSHSARNESQSPSVSPNVELNEQAYRRQVLLKLDLILNETRNSKRRRNEIIQEPAKTPEELKAIEDSITGNPTLLEDVIEKLCIINGVTVDEIVKTMLKTIAKQEAYKEYSGQGKKSKKPSFLQTKLYFAIRQAYQRGARKPAGIEKIPSIISEFIKMAPFRGKKPVLATNTYLGDSSEVVEVT